MPFFLSTPTSKLVTKVAPNPRRLSASCFALSIRESGVDVASRPLVLELPGIFPTASIWVSFKKRIKHRSRRIFKPYCASAFTRRIRVLWVDQNSEAWLCWEQQSINIRIFHIRVYPFCESTYVPENYANRFRVLTCRIKSAWSQVRNAKG